MPQDFVDAINEAVKAVNPDAGRMIHGSMTLGSNFDRWLGPEAMMKWKLDPLPPEETKAFEAKFNEHRDELKRQVVASAVEVELQRMAGRLENFTFDDSNRPPKTNKESVDLREFVKNLENT
jgi:hypothetical protein